jgi:ABC-type amino acid transport substrate-binding protein
LKDLLHVFLRENNVDKNTDHSENISYDLYELRQTSQDPWSFAIPLVPAGSYDLVIRSFFTDIMGEFVLHDIVVN